MTRLYRPQDDFEAIIRILTEAEGGRVTSPFNGIRWDFAYAEDGLAGDMYMIWPDFYAPSGDSLPKDLLLPLSVDLPARMFVLFEESRARVHRQRITAAC